MPSKSKKHRRPQPKRAITSSSDNNIAVTKEAPVTRPVATQTAAQTSVPAGKSARSPAADTLTVSHFTTEIRWIGLVTAIIIILLIVSYYIFR